MAKLDLRHTLSSGDTAVRTAKKRSLPPVPMHGKFRVFSHGGRYYCGVCSKAYAQPGFAWVCVAACAERELPKLREVAEIVNESSCFVCPFCRKHWLNRVDAQLCVQECKAKIVARIPGNSRSLAYSSGGGGVPDVLRGKELQSTLSVAAKAHFSHEAARVGAAAIKAGTVIDGIVLPVAIPAHLNLDDFDFAGVEDVSGEGVDLDDLDVRDAWNDRVKFGGGEQDSDFPSTSELKSSVPIEPVEPVKVEIQPEPALKIGEKVEAVAVPEISHQEPSVDLSEPELEEYMKYKRKPGQKPFVRDGARYVCTACNSKFFTKSEVDRCFQRHPIDESAVADKKEKK